MEKGTWKPLARLLEAKRKRKDLEINNGGCDAIFTFNANNFTKTTGHLITLWYLADGVPQRTEPEKMKVLSFIDCSKKVFGIVLP